MKINHFIFMVIAFFYLLIPSASHAIEENAISIITEEQLDLLNLEDIEKLTAQFDKELSQFVPSFSFRDSLERIREGNFSINFSEFINGILKFFFHEVIANISLMGKLVLLAIMCAVLGNLQNAFERGAIARLAYGICFLVLITLVLSSFHMAIELGKTTIVQMVSFMQALTPILLTLLAALGAFTSTAILHPFIFITLGALSTFYNVIIFPLIFFSAILNIVNNISDKFKTNRFAGLLKEATMFLLGLTFTLFIGALSLQGVGGAVADGISLRTAKFMTGSFIPVVGKVFSDALDAVVGGSLLLKNSIGFFGLISIGVITIFPVIKILAIVIIFKISSALIQPIGDSQITDVLDSMANSLLLVFASVATVALMFFLAIIIVVTAANITVMLR